MADKKSVARAAVRTRVLRAAVRRLLGFRSERRLELIRVATLMALARVVPLGLPGGVRGPGCRAGRITFGEPVRYKTDVHRLRRHSPADEARNERPIDLGCAADGARAALSR